MPGRAPLGPTFWGGRGSGHGTGGGRPLSTGGVGGRLDSLEPSVGFDNACVPDDEDGVTTVLGPVSVLSSSIVSRLPDDSGSRTSLMSLDDIFFFLQVKSLDSLCSGAATLAAGFAVSTGGGAGSGRHLASLGI